MFCYKGCYFGLFFFFKQKTAYEFSACLVGSEMCIRDRRYHALLIAALPAPYGRMVMLNDVWERLRWPDGRSVPLKTVIETSGGRELDSSQYLVGFRLETGLPVWTYDVDGVRLEKRVLMPHLQNTTHVTYRLLSRDPIRVELRPMVAFRLHEAPVNHPVAAPYALQAVGDKFE